MRSSIAKKLTNVSTLYYLFVLEKHFPDDRKKIKQKQNKNVHKLMKRAYEIPFYRKRFDACHLTPDDFHCSEDLQKFPVLTKAELRAWMKRALRHTPRYPRYLGCHEHERLDRCPARSVSVSA